MKVTVCFGSIRVLVPCGAGDLLVRDLVREATFRYKKAIGQGPDTWVGVRALRASSGGILDPDDRVRDVADDRETLTAECTNQAPQPRAAQADGASGSSAGTASPDMFRGGVGGSMRVPEPDSCVEVGAAGADATSGLQVRRGSEPTLHKDTLPPQPQMSESTKRWSAAVVCREECRAPEPPAPPDRPHHFHRQTNRLSMQFSGPGSGVWLDAAERVQTYGSKSLPRDARREPLGQDTSANNHTGHNHIPVNNHNAGHNNPVNNHTSINNHQNPRVEDMLRWVSGVNNVQERPLDLLPEVGNSERDISSAEPTRSSTKGATQTINVNLVKGEKGLGFTITTRDNPTGGHCPIYIKNILPKGAAVSDGRLRAGDRLVSVNGVPVAGRSQQQVVALLRTTPTHSTVDILVERPHARPQRIEAQQYAEKAIGTPNTASTTETTTENGRVSSIVNAINQGNAGRGKIQKSSSKDDLKNQSGDKTLQDALNSSSHSTLGLRNRLILRLDVPVHDSEKAGLGISVKGKVTVGPDPQDLGIFIKSVLNGGAASRDGRLHTNDQLLSVNGVTLVGQSNAEAMESLRRALVHARPHARGSIELTIARRTDSMDSLARWKDDTPPNGNDTTNSSLDNNNSQNCNTVIYNTNEKEVKATDNYQERGLDNNDGRGSKKHASIVTINNNSWVSNQSDDSKGYLERDKDSVTHDSKRDSFEWSRLDGWNPVIGRLTGLRNESYYMATQIEGAVTNGNYRTSMGHVHMSRSPPTHPNVIIEEDFGTRSSVTGGGTESGSESGAGGAGGAGGAFSRDAVGRRSMSEKRHAALDAKQTGTYKKIKEIRAVNTLTNQSGEVGPALGMRKSSSLESLQIAIQETQKKPHSELIYGRTHPPLKHWLTDDNTSPNDIVRGSPQQSSLSHKKSSLLKSLSTMFRIGKPQKKPEPDSCGRSQPGRSSEKSLSRESASSGRWAKLGEHNHPQQPPPSQQRSSGAARAPRRGPAHQPQPQPQPHHHQHQHQQQQMMESAWGPSGHYVNYEEIQQNLHARREKLSEVQIGQMRRQVHAQRTMAEDEMRRSRSDEYYSSQRSSRDGRPQSNYYEYESVPPRRPGKLSHYH